MAIARSRRIMQAMHERSRGTHPLPVLLLWGFTALSAVVGAVLTVAAWRSMKPADAYTTSVNPVAAVVYATLGALIIRRVGNRIGWLLLGVGVGLALSGLMSAYAIVGMVTHPGALPAADIVGTLSEVVFVPLVMGLIYVFVVFPTGRVASPRWRLLEITLGAITGLSLFGFIVTPREVAMPAPGGVSLTFPNPLAVRSLGPEVSTLLVGTLPSLTVVTVPLFAAAAAALMFRYRSSRPDLRQQIKWVAVATLASAGSQFALALAAATVGFQSPVTIVAGLASGFTALLVIPVAITVAILKYRLYDIDFILNRALVYGGLTVLLGLVYVTGVVLVGAVVRSVTQQESSNLAIAASTLAIAALFRPARARVQSFIDRRFYRRRYDATQMVEAFSVRLREEVDLETIRADLLAVVRETLEPSRATLWINGRGSLTESRQNPFKESTRT